WPEGPAGAPQTTTAPFDNTGIMGENDSMFHRGDPVGDDRLASPADLSVESTLAPASGDPQSWQVRNGDEVIAEYPRDRVRFALSWSAQVFADEAAARCADEHLDDLDVDSVLAIFEADLARRGLCAALPEAPLTDPGWIAQVGRAYRIVPSHDPLSV
ncbi:hypothetical protein MK489_23675, partial [Myxococcota bacterium]|nr:hypothetical protein [Myxococcota bacterium]